MKGTEYSPYKMVHHLEALRQGRPVLCRWLITHRCNHECSVCINKHFPLYEPDDELPLDFALDIARQMKDLGVKAISISGGEPTIHREFGGLVEALLSMGFDLGLITNGTQLDNLDVGLLSRFTWIRVSVNSMSEASYRAVHGVGAGSGYWDLVAKFVSQMNSGCVVGSSFLVQAVNVGEIEPFAIWSKQVGFDTCRYSYVRNSNGRVSYSPTMQEKILEQIGKVNSLKSARFDIFGLSDRMDLKMGTDKGYEHCYVSDLQLAITANGGLYRCCSLQNSRVGFLGSLYETALTDLWTARGSQDLSKCPMCWQDKKNEFGEYLMNPYPRHVNFV